MEETREPRERGQVAAVALRLSCERRWDRGWQTASGSLAAGLHVGPREEEVGEGCIGSGGGTWKEVGGLWDNCIK